MPTRPLNPEGGRAERLWFSAPDAVVQRVDRLAELRGMRRTEYLRARFEEVLEADEAALQKQEASKAS